MADSLDGSGPKISSKLPPPPKHIGDRYDVLEVVGTGAAGVVYKVLDKNLNKVFAIKKLHGSSTDSQSVRFQREAKILATLQHTNLLTAFDFGLTNESEPYLVLEYVPGKTLAAWLKDNGPLPVPLALAAFIDIARGLVHAHSKNVIHRDLKPSNIMLIEEEDGKRTFKARILDFGLAMETDSKQFFTTKGVGLGTPKYMPPEQAATRDTDVRSDVYSFGCLMFEALTGTPPFEAETIVQMFEKHANEKPATISDRATQIGLQFSPPLTPGLEAIVDKCLRKNQQERFQTVSQLLDELLKEEAIFQTQQEANRRAKRTVSAEDSSEATATEPKKSIGILIGVPLLLLVVSVTVSFFLFSNANKQEQANSRNGDFSDMKISASNLSAIPEAAANLSIVSMPDRNLPIDPYRDKDIDRMLHQHPDLTELKLGESDVTLKGVALLKDFQHLRTLSIPYRNENGFIELLTPIKSLRSLEFLTPDNACSVTNIDPLQRLNILSLTFKGCNIEPDVFKSLAKFPHLEKLSFTRCHGLTGSVVAPLAECKKLQYLSLNRSDITNDTLKALSKARYHELKLTAPELVTTDGVLYAAQMPRLQKFRMIDTSKDCRPALKQLETRRAELKLPPLLELQTNVRSSNLDPIELIN